MEMHFCRCDIVSFVGDPEYPERESNPHVLAGLGGLSALLLPFRHPGKSDYPTAPVQAHTGLPGCPNGNPASNVIRI